METPPGFNLDHVIDAESRKSANKHAWAPRVFWLFFGVFATGALGSVLYAVFAVLAHGFEPAKGPQYNGFFAPLEVFTRRLLPVLLAGYCLVRGVPQFVSVRLSTRSQVAVLCGVGFLFLKIVEFYELMIIEGVPADMLLAHNSGFVFGQIASSLYFLCLIVPLIWLAPFAAAQKNIPANLRSQNSASFNLDNAVAAWRAELARQPGLIPSDLKELEAHLRDDFAELRKNQLGDAEAFLLAQQRVGAPAPVAAEFAKAAPRRIWAPRLFWLAFGLFCSEVWLHAFPWLWTAVLNLLPVYFDGGQFYGPSTWTWLRYIPTIVVNDLPIFIAAYWLARGVPQFVAKRLTTRRQVVAVGAGMFVLANMHLLYVLTGFLNPWFVVDGNDYRASIFNSESLWQLCLLALMIWLTPRKTTTPARPVAA